MTKSEIELLVECMRQCYGEAAVIKVSQHVDALRRAGQAVHARMWAMVLAYLYHLDRQLVEAA